MGRTKVEELMERVPRLKPVLSTWKVALVEDEPDNMELVLRLMCFFGATVITADGGEAAVALIRKEQPTFVISDLSMPDMDGRQLLQALRADEETRSIPVVALTAHAMSGDRESVLSDGFTAYFSKPLNASEFVVSLLNLFDRPESSVLPEQPDQFG